MILHMPFMGAGLMFKEGEDQKEAKYIAAHNEFSKRLGYQDCS